MASKDASKSVMGNLPSTRPARIGRRERANGGAAPSETAAPAKPKAKAKPKATAAKSAKPKSTTAGPKAATAKPKAAASKPRAVRSGSPALKAAKDKKTASAPPPRKPQPASPPKGAELVTTAVQAAGELAQIGLTLGGQAVKRAVRRLPKP
jgi:hypothetical protein